MPDGSERTSALRHWLDEFVEPSASDTDETGRYPAEAIEAFLGNGLAGLISAKSVGGGGAAVDEAAHIVTETARRCGSTAMIVAMHYSGAAIIEAKGNRHARQALASGRMLATLAFSEAGSRSQFWHPMSTARKSGDGYVLNADKSWVTSASHARAYVWSSQASSGDGVTLWLVERTGPGIAPAGAFNGLGLRGNESAPVSARNARVPDAAMLGEDGDGLNLMLGTVLPVFAILNAACSVGFMQAAVDQTARHCTGEHFRHTGSALRDLPTIRAYLARMRVKTDMAAALLDQAVDAVVAGKPDAMLLVLEAKAAAGETATEVLDLAMRVCGGAAFRKELGIERIFRDARASTVMAPTTDQLYDFIGRAVCGMDLF